jgi:cytochrome P450
MWVLMELVRDKDLFNEIRAEVKTTIIKDPMTGKETIDTHKLMGLPLLQSVFSEVLRLHMSFNVMRQVKEPIKIDRYDVKTGTMLQVPMQVAHYNEKIWSTEGHPADQFWAARHIKYVEEKGKKKRTFNMEGLQGSFFPFGMSLHCPPDHVRHGCMQYNNRQSH